MARLESEIYRPRGMFDDKTLMGVYRALREEATSEQASTVVERIENAGPIMVVDPEVAFYDLENTCERVRIASEMGMEAILLGGSTHANNEASKVIPQIRDIVDSVGGNTLLISFPGTSDQVVEGVDATLSLFLPQLDSIYRDSPQKAQYFTREYFRIIKRSAQLGVPIIPTTYVIFSGGKQTSVELVTGINGIDVQEDVEVDLVMDVLTPWVNQNDLVMLELGSGPDTSPNLGPVAAKVYETTQVRPIVTGGIRSPKLVGEITTDICTPIVFGTVAEETSPDLFGNLYRELREAHPSCQ